MAHEMNDQEKEDDEKYAEIDQRCEEAAIRREAQRARDRDRAEQAMKEAGTW